MLLLKYFHTLRYLKLTQIIARLRMRFYRPRVEQSSTAVLRHDLKDWQKPVPKPNSLLTKTRFRFLNEVHECSTAEDWNHPERSRLWLYNLHYFDFLLAEGEDKKNLLQDNINRWVVENPPPLGVGWEPYTISRRVVNWLKWTLAGHRLTHEAVQSLYVQLMYLRRRLEYHLLANHLFANTKALIFGGAMFEDSEAQQWLRIGRDILKKELSSQILSDGGHIERSPMYHAFMLEDVLDLFNLSCAADLGIEEDLRCTAEAMLDWLSCMVHPDGEIAFFNDAAFGVAPTLVQLSKYAQRLGVTCPSKMAITKGVQRVNQPVCIHLRESGYARLSMDDLTVIADVGELGPDYQLGHAHADTLSFELSVGQKRVFVNSGTSCYQGEQRLSQRQTSAHNTLTVDGADSSEVWGSHRVARRARVQNVSAGVDENGAAYVSGAHDGFNRLAGVRIHRRTWELLPARLKIVDEVEGHGNHELCLRLYLHPEIRVELVSSNSLRLSLAEERKLWIEMDNRLRVNTDGAMFHPEFGVSQNNSCVAGRYFGKLHLTLVTVIHNGFKITNG
jgi:uncharacterized heparinase superfamily protein